MEGSTHTSDMDVSKITSTLDQAAPVHFTRFVSLLNLLPSGRQQLVDDHFLFVSGDKNFIVSGMEHDWPEESSTIRRRRS